MSKTRPSKAWLTVIAIVILFPKALKALKDYEQDLKAKME